MDQRSTAFIGPDTTSIDAGNVGKLELSWAFALPNTTDARSQPVVTTDTLFVAAVSGHLFALDRLTGCTRWHWESAGPLRTALTLGTVRRGDAALPALFLGDATGFVTALDAASGEVLWRTQVKLFDLSMLTGAVVQHGNRLIVPISAIEVAVAANPAYECCKTHGAVRMLDANTGDILWTTRLAPEAQPTGKTSAGVAQWGPSGVPVWSTPTVDAERGVVYVGTGENTSSPATDKSDSIVALSLEDGTIEWHFQALAGDVFNNACAGMQKGPNCPKEDGPDFDFGASVIIARDSRGRDLLLAGQKSGEVFALDPDAEGKVVWRRRVGAGSALGGVHWGLATSEGRVYVPISDPPFPQPDYVPRTGLYALAIDDGAVVWQHPIERGCETNIMAYFQRETLYPECSFFYGLSAAPMALPGVVFAPALDGKLRAFAAKTGEILWSYDTVQPYDTVNGVRAHGGAIDSAGVIAVGDMVYVQSGYSLFGQLPGNVLLAFKLP